MGKGLNLNDFNVESENIISSENKTKNNSKATISKKKMQKENLAEKLQIGVTQAEFDKLYSDFEKSIGNSIFLYHLFPFFSK
jgi:hypothetical protein